MLPLRRPWIALLALALPALLCAGTLAPPKAPAPQYTVMPGVDVYASPYGGIQSRLVQEIDRCKKTLEICVYNISNPTLASAIKSAKSRGVSVRVVSDVRQAQGSSSAVPGLQKAGVPVHLLGGTDSASAIMHMKIAVFDHGRSEVGSCNWSVAAMTGNYENADFFWSSPGLTAALLMEFNDLWKLPHGSTAAAAFGKTPHIGVAPGVDLYFSPNGGARARLLSEIDHCAKTLDMAMDLLTDSAVASALVAARKRGVAVRLVTDEGESEKSLSRIDALKGAGIPVVILGSGMAVMMHHKFAVFDHLRVVGGSYNDSRKAEFTNYEISVWFAGASMASAYGKIFASMWDQP